MTVRLTVGNDESLVLGLKDLGQTVTVEVRGSNQGMINLLQSQRDVIISHLEGKDISANIVIDPNASGTPRREIGERRGKGPQPLARKSAGGSTGYSKYSRKGGYHGCRNQYYNGCLGSGTTTSSTGSNLSTISNNEFLQILIAQLQNQDPLNPTDPSQFVTELAEMTQVQSLQSMQTSLSNLATSFGSGSMSQWASAVGDYMQVNDTSISQGDEVVLSPTSTITAR